MDPENAEGCLDFQFSFGTCPVFQNSGDGRRMAFPAFCGGGDGGSLSLDWNGKKENRADLLILDWNMPDGAGDELCGWARERWPGLPIILLTVRNSTQEVVAGFRNGADDYVTKPFELDVLYSRIQALLRRSLPKNPAILSASEYELLRILMEHKGKTIARGWLLERIWDQKGSYVNDNTLTVTMKRLREKLFCPACLKTIRSLGYRMEDTV